MQTWINGFLEKNPDLARLPVAARGAHATHFELGAGVRRAVITAAPQYFRGPQGWQAYDLQLRADAAAQWGAPGAPVRLAPDGSVVLGHYQQHTRSVGVLARDAYTPLAQLPRGRVAGPRLLRENGPFRHELMLTENGVKEELHILQPPDLQDGYLVYETLAHGSTQGLAFSPGSAVDAGGYPLPLHRFNEGRAMYTGLAAEDLAQAEFPIVIDPTVTFGVLSDAVVWSFASTYSATRLTSAGHDLGTTDLFVGQAYQAPIPRYHNHRAALKFSLASLNPLAVIYAANLHLACVVDASTLADFNVQIVKYSWAAQDPITSGNREAVYDGILSASLDAVWRNTSGLVTDTLLASAPLDLAWLVPGGTAYYGLRSSRDAAGTAPPSNGNEYVRLAAAGYATPALRPALVLDYFAVPSASGKLVQPSPRVRIQDTRIKLRARRRRTLLSAQNREE